MNLNKIYEIPPTLRLYNLDAYKREEHAKVLYVENNIAVFDQTIFYAESGGQIYDTGSIDGNRVVSVKKYLGELSKVKRTDINVPSVKINTRIVHEFSQPINFNVGDVVSMSIDWERRYKIMKNHTLAHFLFSGLNSFFIRKGIDLFIKGCAINDEKGSFSLNNKITSEDLGYIEENISSIYESGVNITMTPEKNNDEVYYWTYKDVIIPCGGTHIKNTDEISDFRIWKKSEGKNKSKIYIKEL
ncbi:alanyl-tRNA editing protein [Salmonella enterica]|uniref:alanyl-tRNA editing protein n=1 Tax=Salmonella enterica TaxID=28901 RepID=UPI000B546124|nr:alanyl-tRNA editing protein [Salmonella enterica]ECE0550251.1 alanyl-tRNA editing protein [Salmonella enterica subsp. enterica]ECU8750571.1 alanyl-tRNA editing protein [Salmonella enterica subsp. diarizonae str. CFSAN000558]EDO5655852.1 alanyl-tRNA editing protein [Salmonella enterica subsp. enterica serovar Javiana]EEJ7166551.1 alanyl-tRNA editing protein [Salmonella enterica subsp. enterica serovar Hvittingfoss]EEL3737384.1 alanyl-tRNA editing protein [Salmonella enterica subsp. enterica 